MYTLAKIALEACALGVLGLVLAFCANSVRTSGAIDMSRSYYDPLEERVACESSSDFSVKSEEAYVQASASEAAVHNDFCLQSVSLHEAAELFEDPSDSRSVCLFVDARDDDDFAEGHIPGAVRADRHQFDRYVEEILVSADLAGTIVIYSKDGEWGEGRPMCCNLEEYGIPHESIFLLDGGWQAWVDNDMPIQAGSTG